MSRIGIGVLSVGLAMATGALVGCATQASLAPPPSAAQVNAAESAVKLARQGGAEGSPGKHVKLAEQQLAEARERISRGDNHGAGLALARAEVDAELSQVLRRREKALADAEVIEQQLAQTRKSQPASGSDSPPPPPLPSTAAPGAVAPGPLPGAPLPGTTGTSSPLPTTVPDTLPTSTLPSTTSPSTIPANPPRGTGAPGSVDPTKNSPATNKTPITAPGPSGPGTGIPTGPAGTGTATP